MDVASNVLLDLARTKCCVLSQHAVGNALAMRKNSKPKKSYPEREAFSVRLAAVRRAYGAEIGTPELSMEAFATAIGLEGETYRRYERGETEPNIRTYIAIQQKTGVRLDNLLTGQSIEADGEFVKERNEVALIRFWRGLLPGARNLLHDVLVGGPLNPGQAHPVARIAREGNNVVVSQEITPSRRVVGL